MLQGRPDLHDSDSRTTCGANFGHVSHQLHSARPWCQPRRSGILQHHSEASLFGSCAFGTKTTAVKTTATPPESDGIFNCHGRGLRRQGFGYLQDAAPNGHTAAHSAEVVDRNQTSVAGWAIKEGDRVFDCNTASKSSASPHDHHLTIYSSISTSFSYHILDFLRFSWCCTSDSWEIQNLFLKSSKPRTRKKWFPNRNHKKELHRNL